MAKPRYVMRYLAGETSVPAGHLHEPGRWRAAIADWDALLWLGGNPLPPRTDFWFASYVGLVEWRDSAGDVQQIPAVMGLDGLFYPAHRINDHPENVPPELTYGDITEPSTGRTRPVVLTELSHTMDARALSAMLFGNVRKPGALNPLRQITSSHIAQIAIIEPEDRWLSYGLPRERSVHAVLGYDGLFHPVEDVLRARRPESQLIVHGYGVAGIPWAGPAFDNETYEAAENAQQANELPIYRVLDSRPTGWRQQHLRVVELPDGSLIPVVRCRDKVWRPVHLTDPRQLDAPVNRRIALACIAAVVTAGLFPGDVVSPEPVVRRDRLSLPFHFGGIVTSSDDAYSKVTSTFAFHSQYSLTHRQLPTGGTTGRCDMLGLGDFRRPGGWGVWAGVVRTGDRPGEAQLIFEVPRGSVVLFRRGDAFAFNGQGVPTAAIEEPSIIHRDGAATAWSDAPTIAAQPGEETAPCLLPDGGQQLLPLEFTWIPNYQDIGSTGRVPAYPTPVVSLQLLYSASARTVDIAVAVGGAVGGSPIPGYPASVIGWVTVVVPSGVNPTQVANGLRPLIAADGSELPFLNGLLAMWAPQVFGSDLGDSGQALGSVPTYTTSEWPPHMGVETDGGTVYFWTGELGPGEREIVTGGQGLA